MKQVVKISLDDVYPSCVSHAAVYRDDTLQSPYLLYRWKDKEEKRYTDCFDSLTEATENALAAAMGHYDK